MWVSGRMKRGRVGVLSSVPVEGIDLSNKIKAAKVHATSPVDSRHLVIPPIYLGSYFSRCLRSGSISRWRRNLLNVLDFLKRPNASELVSRTKDMVNLHEKFRHAIEAACPGTIGQLEIEAPRKAAARKKKAAFWNSAVDANTGGFKFSFIFL